MSTRPLARPPRRHDLLARILDDRALVQAVRALPADAVQRLIAQVGLEDAGEIVALCTTAQLEAVFDEDLWRSAGPGRDEQFDPDRFLVWLEIMLEGGEDLTVRKLVELPEQLVALGLHAHVVVVDMPTLMEEIAEGVEDAESAEKALDYRLFHEFERYHVFARQQEGWDTILALLVALDRDHHGHLERLLSRCARASSHDLEESGGLAQLLDEAEMLAADVAADREDRRAQAGYISPSSAAAFLELARTGEAASGRDAVTRAYFRELSRAPVATGSELPPGVRALELLTHEHDLEEAARERAQPALPSGLDDHALPLSRAMAALRRDDPATHAKRIEELAYLANVLAAGAMVDGRAFRAVEAAHAAVAICNLGAEALGTDAPTAIEDDCLFRAGWRELYERVVMPTARTISTLASERTGRATARLRAALGGAKPWLAVSQLDALGEVLAPDDLAGLRRLLSQCPTLPSSDPRERAPLRFIASRRDVATAASFLEAVASSDRHRLER